MDAAGESAGTGLGRGQGGRRPFFRKRGSRLLGPFQKGGQRRSRIIWMFPIGRRVCWVSALRAAIRTSRCTSSASAVNTLRGVFGCLATVLRTYHFSSEARTVNTAAGAFRFRATRARTCHLSSPLRVISMATGAFGFRATRARTASLVSAARVVSPAIDVFGFAAAASRTLRLTSLTKAANVGAGVVGLPATDLRTDDRLWVASCSSTSGDASGFWAMRISLIVYTHPCWASGNGSAVNTSRRRVGSRQTRMPMETIAIQLTRPTEMLAIP